MTNIEMIKELFVQYMSDYDLDKYTNIWEAQCEKFRIFWENKIMPNDDGELNDQEVDEIILILDKNAKGSIKTTEAIARAMIPQGAWRRMFNEIKSNNKLKSALNIMVIEKDWKKKAKAIDEVYEINKDKKNNLTGPSANAINCFIAAYDSFNNLSVISMKDRYALITFLAIDPEDKISMMTFGEQVAYSNLILIDEFKKIGIDGSARILSDFLYDSDEMKQLWKPEEKADRQEGAKIKSKHSIKVPPTEDPVVGDPALFYMEEQLEDFLVENWEKTELGKEYELIEEEGEFVSQQYLTDIGEIDILAKEKSSDRYVVIELKKGQTSDDTIGQLLRYMGWIKEKKSGKQPPKGIIIAGKYDERLNYASKMMPDIEIYLYKVDFKLDQFKKR